MEPRPVRLAGTVWVGAAAETASQPVPPANCGGPRRPGSRRRRRRHRGRPAHCHGASSETCSCLERRTGRWLPHGRRAPVLRYAASRRSLAARTISPSTTTVRKKLEEGSKDPEPGNHARERSHARSTRQSRRVTVGSRAGARGARGGRGWSPPCPHRRRGSPPRTPRRRSRVRSRRGVGGGDRRSTARRETPSEVRDQESARRPKWVSRRRSRGWGDSSGRRRLQWGQRRRLGTTRTAAMRSPDDGWWWAAERLG